MQMRAYALILMAVLLLGSAFYLMGQLVLYRSGETLSLDQLIARQRATDGLYFGFANAPGNYKLAAYAWRKPDIVILGSSRANREHQEFYNRPSYSMGGLIYSPEDAIETLDLLIPLHKPKIVIYELDFICLCTNQPGVASQTSFPRPHNRPASGLVWSYINRLTLVPRLVARGILPARQALDIALGRYDTAPKGIKLFGLSALREQYGFRLDGALLSVNAEVPAPTAIAEALHEVETGTKHFLSGCYYNPVPMADLEMLRQELDQQGIKLVVLLPPIAPTVYRKFISAPDKNSGYYRTWLRKEEKQPFPGLYNLLDGASIGAPDSEYGDAVHGGDVSEARMLLKAAEDPKGIMKDIINRPFLERLVWERKGEFGVEMSYFRAADAPAGDAIGPLTASR
jgi:hypothetical protein